MRTRGYELELSGQVAPRWSVHAAFSHKISRRDGQKVATLTPENQFSVYANHRLSGPWSGLTLGGGARWQDKTWGDMSNPVTGQSRHTVRGYWRLDAMASYRFSDSLSGALNINNLLDKRYYTLFDAFSTYTWGAPRSVNVSLNYRF